MRRTTIAALPLLLSGVLWVAMGAFHSSVRPLVIVFGLFHFAAGFLLVRNPSRLVRGLGIVAWVPGLLGFPFGTIFAIFAIKWLRDPNCNVRPKGPPAEAATPHGRSCLIQRLVSQAFDIAPDSAAAQASYRHGMTIPPGRIISFLDELRFDYGFDVSGEDAPQVDSTQELLDLLAMRNPFELNQPPAASPAIS